MQELAVGAGCRNACCVIVKTDSSGRSGVIETFNMFNPDAFNERSGDAVSMLGNVKENAITRFKSGRSARDGCGGKTKEEAEEERNLRLREQEVRRSDDLLHHPFSQT